MLPPGARASYNLTKRLIKSPEIKEGNRSIKREEERNMKKILMVLMAVILVTVSALAFAEGTEN